MVSCSPEILKIRQNLINPYTRTPSKASYIPTCLNFTDGLCTHTYSDHGQRPAISQLASISQTVYPHTLAPHLSTSTIWPSCTRLKCTPTRVTSSPPPCHIPRIQFILFAHVFADSQQTITNLSGWKILYVCYHWVAVTLFTNQASSCRFVVI